MTKQEEIARLQTALADLPQYHIKQLADDAEALLASHRCKLAYDTMLEQRGALYQTLKRHQEQRDQADNEAAHDAK